MPPVPATPPRGSSDTPEEEVVQGSLEHVTFHSEETGFSVLRVQPERGFGDPDSLFGTGLVAVGRCERPVEGVRVRLRGSWTIHPAHGRRFEFGLVEVLPPADADGLRRYLASSAFPGVGAKLAERIVEELGVDALQIIVDEPERLAGVQGLRREVREDLSERVRAELGAHRVHAFLLGLGLGPIQARSVIQALGPDCEGKVREDPYLVGRAVPGMGFRTSDRIARELGLEEDAPARLRAGLYQALQNGLGEGHSGLVRGRLLETAAELLGALEPSPALEAELDELCAQEELLSWARGAEELVYLPAYGKSEERLAHNLAGLLSQSCAPLAREGELAAAEQRSELVLHPLQREAVLGLLATPFGLLTGGPGVGKTTIVRLLVELAERSGAEVALASPTGRAAKRLGEATGREAMTIHRLLGYEPGTGRYAHDAHTPIEADVIVVDEVSMLGVVLAHHLVKAVRSPTRLILVGDPDQLPSVGAGNVLADLLACAAVPAFRLTEVYRQAAESGIVTNAHKVLRGEWPAFAGGDAPYEDFYWFPAEDEGAAARRVVEVVTERIPRRFGLDWVSEVQVLAPMYKGECGVDHLNERLREALGQGGHELEYKGRLWRTGDRVIHTRNDYERELFNGDMGRVAKVEPDGSGLLVRYPERDVHYRPDELSDLSPAFAITVHRSQGSEYPAIVLPLVPRHHLMLQRHLVYTAVTRAKRLVVLVGARRAIQQALDMAEARRRESGLRERVERELVEAPDASGQRLL